LALYYNKINVMYLALFDKQTWQIYNFENFIIHLQISNYTNLFWFLYRG